VLGNPPYIAAKSGLDAGGRKKIIRTAKGQHDQYLGFLEAVLENDLVQPSGVLSMILPDPFLVRHNGARLRAELFGEWETVRLLHIAGTFPEAGVANVIPVWRRRRPNSRLFPVLRVEGPRALKQLTENPDSPTGCVPYLLDAELVRARPGAEVLYLLADEHYKRIVEAVRVSDGQLRPQFVALGEIAHVSRGEEIGKRAVFNRAGQHRFLLGGQSVKRYRIAWEGFSADPLRKPEELYRGPKIVLQKSAPRLVAALDLGDHAFPQSIYAIKLKQEAATLALGRAQAGCLSDLYFLLALLNSHFLNEYLYATTTGYKLVQPQIEIQDVRALPIPRIRAETPDDKRRDAVRLAIGNPERARKAAQAPDVARDILAALARRLSHPTADPAESSALQAAVDEVVERLYGLDRNLGFPLISA